MMMVKTVIIGAGFAGCGAAVAAAQAGGDVTLLERMDDIFGNGLAGGNMNMNGRFVAAEEAKAMGGGLVFEILDSVTRHRNVEIPLNKHMTVYDVFKAPIKARAALEKLGVNILLMKRATSVKKDGNRIVSVATEDGKEFEGDAFVDCTGSIGGTPTCTKYGRGCAMCIIRCPTFGVPVSIAKKADVEEYMWRNLNGGIGGISGAIDLLKPSINPKIVEELERKGSLVVPLPKECVDMEKIRIKCCTQVAMEDYSLNLVLVDTGFVKLCAPYFALELLRKVPGFEEARIAEPLGGGKGNSVRYVSMVMRDNSLKVDGLDNLYCGGEKSGPEIGLTEAYVSGLVAGHNAVRNALGKEPIVLPRTTAIGEFIVHVNDEARKPEDQRQRGGFTFAGGIYFERMKSLGLYTIDVDKIRKRVEENHLTGVFAKKLC